MHRTIPLALAFLLIAGAAQASAPEPRKAIEIDRFMGRWHEILRTPNDAQASCFAASQDWSVREGGGFSIRQQCRKGSRRGEIKVVQTRAKPLNPGMNTKWEASFFGGLIRQRYWVLDRADDYSWMIASTAAGKFPALLAREPGLDASQIAALKSRMAAMGLDVAGLQAAP